MESTYVQLSEVRLHTMQSGSGAPLVLLHGFPDHWRVWTRQLEELSQHYRVVAPDLRGYNLSERPTGIQSYQAERVAQDIAELIESLGGPVFLAGHDWGGLISWILTARRPELIRRVAVLNCPHPSAFRRHLLTNPAQWRRSWYMAFFQLPWLPERVLKRRLRALLRRGSRHFTPEHIEATASALEQPGALKAALNYYRAAARRKKGPPLPKIQVPTQLVWGTDDQALGPELALSSARYVESLFQLSFVPGAGHWVQVDAASLVNAQLLTFFEAPGV